MTFGIGRGFADVQYSENIEIELLNWNMLINFEDTLILTRSSSRNCKMTFIIGRGFAERQILKK